MPPKPQASFGKLRPRREKGLSIFSPFRWSWSSCPWEPLLGGGSSLKRADRDGMATTIANDQPASPGIFELSIAHKNVPQKRVVVYLGAAENIRNELTTLVQDGGELRGFLDHGLKEGHVVWFRVQLKPSVAAATAAKDSALANYDYAWVNQPGAKGRSLMLRPEHSCCSGACCFCGKAKGRVTLREGPPKFLQEKQQSGLFQMLSGNSRKR